ncbi:MAG: GNAT family N-acetyltransferase [Candidatus Zixiibacteriota bacterium]
MSAQIWPNADIIPYNADYAQAVRSWIDSKMTLYNVSRGTDFPPAQDVVESWQRTDVSSFLLISAGLPVAYAELWRRPLEVALEIAHLLVSPEHRLSGFGTTMLKLLCDRASGKSRVERVLVNLYNENEAALACFLKAGFELTGTSAHVKGLRMMRVLG